MFTARESALGIYNGLRGMGRSRVLGGDMEAVTADRIARLDEADRLIDQAVGTPRSFVGEPCDERLAQMKDHLARIRAAVEQAGVRAAPLS